MEDDHLRFALRAVLYGTIERRDAIKPLLDEIKRRKLTLAEDFESVHHAFCASAVSAHQSIYPKLSEEAQQRRLAHLAWFFHHLDDQPGIAEKLSWWDVTTMDPPNPESPFLSGSTQEGYDEQHVADITKTLCDYWPHLSEEAKNHIRHRLATFFGQIGLDEVATMIDSQFTSPKPRPKAPQKRLGKHIRRRG